ncbi:protein COFACTOR ASSEMBLY OF COMPLEX C SUBUNIT B CCB2, chloroplastic [Cinnamomum micranthum f. kanehirae]|uniref:Protein COFACTOR ASSEMBLY OF COMPLEX C SUBUNIT B CCB2, chloroplastic n=1 Tax=Cinnamomum micranthum f. kanehirae TaxID=337451 RepID=A0A3S3MKW3_9MAGN|nr:protein COFACTOR ASSEMBLY OF COMPLEX C SUBUNIT B CCB2, chloroplastic [Cinnamomum micranthum f. kanehirae]
MMVYGTDLGLPLTSRSHCILYFTTTCTFHSKMEFATVRPFHHQQQLLLLHFRSSNSNKGLSFPNLSKTTSIRAKSRPPQISARLDTSQEPNPQQQQQLNLSVLRFTFGIPGLDESYLPRYIGFAFGSLLLLNHVAGSNSVTSAQLRTEVLGLCLGAFSISLPYIGKFLKGADPVDRSILPEGNRQIFVMPEDLSNTQKEELAWGSYVLLRNTNTMSVLISVQDALCIRGCWNIREDASKVDILELFKRQIQQIGFSDLKDALYFPLGTEYQAWEILPKGTLSLLVQPLPIAPNLCACEVKLRGFILLVSNVSNAYSDKDRAWIRVVASKFLGWIGISSNGF